MHEFVKFLDIVCEDDIDLPSISVAEISYDSAQGGTSTCIIEATSESGALTSRVASSRASTLELGLLSL